MELTTTAGTGSGLFSPEDPAESSAAASELEPFSLLFLFCVTLLRGAPWAVTRCFLRYHLFFTTFSHSEHDTPENMLKENFVKSHKIHEFVLFSLNFSKIYLEIGYCTLNMLGKFREITQIQEFVCFHGIFQKFTLRLDMHVNNVLF